MIDTVRFIRRCLPKQSFLLLRQHPPSGWESKSQASSNSKGDIFSTTKLFHQRTGLNVHFIKRGQAVIQASLPRLLYGTNARLITTQPEIERALRLADKLLLEVAVEQVAITKRRFLRADLVWQVRGDIDDFIAAHHHLPHPGKIRGDRKSVVYYRETILWPGGECSLSMYDKLKEMRKGRGEIVRIELRLQNGTLRRAMRSGDFLGKLSLPKCYQAFRRVLLRLHPAQVYHVTTRADVLYWAAIAKWQINGRPAVDVLLDGYSDARRKGAINRIRNYHLKAHNIDWKKLLPLKMPQALRLRKGCSYYEV